MPTVYTQTDDCLDVIGRLNQEFFQANDEIHTLRKQLSFAQEDMAREYWQSLIFEIDLLYETMKDSIPILWSDHYKDSDLRNGVTSGGDFSGIMGLVSYRKR